MFREWSSHCFSRFRLPRCATGREGSAGPICCCGCSVPSSEPKNYFIIYNLSHNSACVIWFHINFLVVIRIGLRCLSWGQHQHTSSRGGTRIQHCPLGFKQHRYPNNTSSTASFPTKFCSDTTVLSWYSVQMEPAVSNMLSTLLLHWINLQFQYF